MRTTTIFFMQKKSSNLPRHHAVKFLLGPTRESTRNKKNRSASHRMAYLKKVMGGDGGDGDGD